MKQPRPSHPAPAVQPEWVLRLYIAGQTPKALTAFANLKRICAEHLEGRYQVEVIDLVENPALAAGDQILAVPTLVRKLPVPVRKIMATYRTQNESSSGWLFARFPPPVARPPR